MASCDLNDDEILFIEEIKPSTSTLSRTPKTQLNKIWLQQKVTHVRSPLVATNLNQINTKSEFSTKIGIDIKDFDLGDLSLLSPKIKSVFKREVRNNSDDLEIIELDDDVKPLIKNELKGQNVKVEINKREKVIFEAPSIIPHNISNSNELMSLLNDRKAKTVTKKQRAEQQQKQAIIDDPNQLQTGFDEDAESAIPAEIYKIYEPKKCNSFFKRFLLACSNF